MDAIIEIGKVLGLPGLVMMVWYLLERDRQKNAAKAESERTAAMTVGFQSLSGKIDSHAQDDADRHADTQNELAALGGAIYTALDLTPVRQPKHKTPPRGIYAIRKPTVKDDD